MAAVEQSRFLPRTPTPSFSSPLHQLDARPAMDRSTATTASMTPTSASIAGQRHDRDDVSPSAVAVEVAAVDDNAMDTTPDVDTDATTATATATATTPAPAEASHGQGEPVSAVPSPPTATNEDDVDATTQPPPPPPPPPPIDPMPSDTESSDDDGLPPWHPMHEDVTTPDQDELNEIEASPEHSALDHEYWETKTFLPLEEPEHTAGETGRIEWRIDAYNGTRENPNRDLVMKSEVVTIGGHQWQIKFYPKGNDSDYLSVYLECLSVMEPKKDGVGEDEDASDKSDDSSKEALEREGEEAEGSEHVMALVQDAPTNASAPLISIDAQHAPLPLLGSKTMPKRKAVAAQVSVVLYNPTEPRVHYSKTALHRFCSGSPDWGWTRFHGPYYDIAHRMRGQRQPLLHNDKLAFTAHIRIVHDETNCLWEHPNRENPWDSFAMAGLQGLMLGEDASAPGGNMISAVASWMLFKPFRMLLYGVKVPDVYHEALLRPKPLINALQKVLYMLRTQVDPDAGAIALDDVLDALEWYGIHERLDKLDVMETWEILRQKLEEELVDTEYAATLQAICGPKRDYTVGVPSYRVPVVGVNSMQQAIDASPDFAVFSQPLPQLLTIEMERQDFDLKTRSYVKVLNKVTLDERVTVNGTGYLLYGFVVHKQTLQSYVYQPILRPEGPGSRWYSYSDSKDENQVRCLTKREAVDAHEGKPGSEKVVGNDAVAYIAMYLRDDVAQTAFTVDADAEQWAVPAWIVREVENSRAFNLPPPPPPLNPSNIPSTAPDHDANLQAETVPPKPLEFHVYDSRVFLQHEGPGVFDVYSPKYQQNSDLVKNVTLSSRDGCKAIREKLVAAYPEIRDARQLRFWFLDPIRGALGRPNILGTGKIEYSSGTYDRRTDTKEWGLDDSPLTNRIWVHITDFDKLPELPKEKEAEITEKEDAMNDVHQVTQSVEPSQTEDSNVGASASVVDPLPVEGQAQSEDTTMSEPDEPILEQPATSVVEAEGTTPETAVRVDDMTMDEMEAIPSGALPAAGTVNAVPHPVVFEDTEMGGTQDDLPPPPPPPADLSSRLTQPPPPARVASPVPPPDEIYFFLKFWNPEKQSLEPRGSHIALKSDKVDETVANLLTIAPDDRKKMDMWEEEELSATRPIKHRRTFAQVDLHNTAIVIVGLPLTCAQRDALAACAAFPDPEPYLASFVFARNFPYKLNGHFTYRHFSSESYKGEIKNGHFHGHGTLVYHSGATYTGSFRLGQRHGHGLYTFQNGDTYDGDWAADTQHGNGTFVEAATGNTYVGGWKADKRFGEGVTHWKNAQEAERLCRICWEEEAEAAFYDCGHVVACLGCAREVQTCPVCRKRVITVLKLFYVA